MRHSTARRRLAAPAGAFATIALAGLAPAQAVAAEVVAAPASPGEVTVTRGTVASVPLTVRAEGRISCFTRPAKPATYALETQYSLVGGGVAEGGVSSGPLPFFTTSGLSLAPLGSCPVTWARAPDPYRVTATVAVGPNVAPGLYDIPLRSAVANPSGLEGFGKLEDAAGSKVTVRVVDPPPPPEFKLPPPRENRSVNLLPVRGLVTALYPGTNKRVRVEEPVQVPVNTRVDARRGFVDLVSDKNGRGAPQLMTFWNAGFGVGYTRAIVPGTAGAAQRAANPITELRVTAPCGGKGPAPAASAAGKQTATTSRRRRRLFGRGKGRFRTRGSFGAGTVRGTYWYTEPRCDGTLFGVIKGKVSVRDFGFARTIELTSGDAYLATSPDPRKGATKN